MPIFKRKNENFFKKWNPEMAYVLGFFAADGNLTLGKRGNRFIEFTSTDRDILEKIKKEMALDHKIGQRLRNLKNENWKDSFRIQIGSKEMFEDLRKLGFRTRKSKELAYPNVPSKYLADFVRGYFDGDGHVSSGIYLRKDRVGIKRIIFSGFTSGTKRFLNKLKNVLTDHGVVQGGTLYYQKGYRLHFAIRDSLNLYKFLYKDVKNGLYLARKKKVFEAFFKDAAVV